MRIVFGGNRLDGNKWPILSEREEADDDKGDDDDDSTKGRTFENRTKSFNNNNKKDKKPFGKIPTAGCCVTKNRSCISFL